MHGLPFLECNKYKVTCMCFSAINGSDPVAVFCLKQYVKCMSRILLYMQIEYCVYVNMHHVSAQGINECMINVCYYRYNLHASCRVCNMHCDCHHCTLADVCLNHSHMPHRTKGISSIHACLSTV